MLERMKQLVLIVAGVVIGMVMLYASIFIHVTRGGPAVFWGFPFVWNVISTGPQGVCRDEGITVFGVCVIKQFYANFIGDLLFWLAVSQVVVQLFDHFAISYMRKKIKIQRTKGDSTPTYTINPVHF
jgi:hypothetical protein